MKHSLFSAALLLLPLAAAAQVPMPEKAATCVACHGEAGAKPIAPNYPVIAGQYADYMAQTLRDYRAGIRKNAIMMPQASGLTDDEIKALSRYFAQQPGPLYTPSLHTGAR